MSTDDLLSNFYYGKWQDALRRTDARANERLLSQSIVDELRQLARDVTIVTAHAPQPGQSVDSGEFPQALQAADLMLSYVPPPDDEPVVLQLIRTKMRKPDSDSAGQVYFDWDPKAVFR